MYEQRPVAVTVVEKNIFCQIPYKKHSCTRFFRFNCALLFVYMCTYYSRVISLNEFTLPENMGCVHQPTTLFKILEYMIQWRVSSDLQALLINGIKVGVPIVVGTSKSMVVLLYHWIFVWMVSTCWQMHILEEYYIIFYDWISLDITNDSQTWNPLIYQMVI